GIAPHDQGVFSVVRVVAAANPARFEPGLFVQPDRYVVGDADLERVAAAALAAGELEEPLEQAGRNTFAAVLGSDSEIHHMPRVDVPGDDQEAEELAAVRLERAEGDRRRLRELPREHRARPGRRVGRALDRLDRGEIAQLEPPEVDLVRGGAHVRVLSASGIRRYRGSSASAGPNSRASAAWKRARGRCRSSSSAGISAPAASSTDRYRTAPLPTHSVSGDGRNAPGSSTRASFSR